MPENSQTQYDPRVRLNVTSDFKSATIEMPNGTEIAVGNVTAQTDPLTGKIQTIAKLTQAQYDAIAVKDDSTLYVIVT